MNTHYIPPPSPQFKNPNLSEEPSPPPGLVLLYAPHCYTLSGTVKGDLRNSASNLYGEANIFMLNILSLHYERGVGDGLVCPLS